MSGIVPEPVNCCKSRGSSPKFSPDPYLSQLLPRVGLLPSYVLVAIPAKLVLQSWILPSRELLQFGGPVHFVYHAIDFGLDKEASNKHEHRAIGEL